MAWTRSRVWSSTACRSRRWYRKLTGLPTLFVRKKAKDYGTRRLAEGGELADRRLAVIEDVVSSGGQLIASCEALRKRGAEIADVICVIDRETGGAANLAEHGLQLRAVWTMSQLRHAAGACISQRCFSRMANASHHRVKALATRLRRREQR